MKITSIDIYHIPRKLTKPFVTSLGYNTQAQSIYVRIKTDQGLEGLGECTPSPYINGETYETCMVVGRMLAKALLDKDPRNIEDNVAVMGKVIYGNTSIKSAFDIALYDLSSKAEDKPLYAFLGGSINKTIYTDYTVSVGASESMVEDALKVKEAGYFITKVKVGKNAEQDVADIGAIREAVGDAMNIRIDANQGWGVEEAAQSLSAMESFNIQYCEEPIKRYKFDFLPALKGVSPIKIMADESVLDHYDAHRLINNASCDLINIKLGKSSGIYKALKIIKAAEKVDMGLQLGGFLESKVLFTANTHLAYTSDCCRYYDFDSPLFSLDDPVIGGMKYGDNGQITLTEGAGLGLKLDPVFLKNAEKINVRT